MSMVNQVKSEITSRSWVGIGVWSGIGEWTFVITDDNSPVVSHCTNFGIRVKSIIVAIVHPVDWYEIGEPGTMGVSICD